jgi:hypothetical protein
MPSGQISSTWAIVHRCASIVYLLRAFFEFECLACLEKRSFRNLIEIKDGSHGWRPLSGVSVGVSELILSGAFLTLKLSRSLVLMSYL